MTKNISVVRLWIANKSRRWPKLLLDRYNANLDCKDTDTIKYWIECFTNGHHGGIIYVNRNTLEVGDGNHRLVAAYISNKPTLQVIFT